MRKLPALIAVTAAGMVSVGVVAAHAVTSSNAVAVRLNEFNVSPAVQGARAGKVTFLLENTGKAEHEFVVLKTIKAAGSPRGQGWRSGRGR